MLGRGRKSNEKSKGENSFPARRAGGTFTHYYCLRKRKGESISFTFSFYLTKKIKGGLRREMLTPPVLYFLHFLFTIKKEKETLQH